MATINELLRKKRLEQRVSQDKLAHLSGVPSTTISRIESGETKNPGFNTILILLKQLKQKISITTDQT